MYYLVEVWQEFERQVLTVSKSLSPLLEYRSQIKIVTLNRSFLIYYTDQQTQNTHTHTYILYTFTQTYLNNILYIISTPTCFDASVSSSGSIVVLLC